MTEESTTTPSSSKRRKLLSPEEEEHDDDADQSSLSLLLESWLGKDGNATCPPPTMQSLLAVGGGGGAGKKGVVNNKIRQDLYKLQTLFDTVGFRTSIVQSPRLAVSLYKDSCVPLSSSSSSSLLSEQQQQQQQQQQQIDYLLTMLGVHPDQEKREIYYKDHFRERYCSYQFLARIKFACRKAMKDPIVMEWIEQQQQQQQQNTTTSTTHNSNNKGGLDVKQFMKVLLKADTKLRQEQLDHELERIHWYNCSLSNALVQQFLFTYHNCIIKDVFFKSSPNKPKYERITFYLYDPNIDIVKPTTNFIFLPDLYRVLLTTTLPLEQQHQHQQQQSSSSSINNNNNNKDNDGTKGIVQDMMVTFWSHLLRHGGYYASTTMKNQLSPALERYFMSGLRQDPKIPLKLNAHFDPCEPISLYLWGKAGAGKSSFVRHVPPAIQAAVESHADPELLCRFVKQALNKPYKDLCLELELRPNNNDLSVMSIIQSRKCTMTQSKPGLVVIDLEEMPQYFDDTNNNDDDNNNNNDNNGQQQQQHHDPNQVQVCQLISQRFGGRKGEYDAKKKAPRNSEKRGIGNDASLITLFTSNYTLEGQSQEALQRLPMFQNLTTVQMTAITGKDRTDFAHAYFQQSVQDRIGSGGSPSSSYSGCLLKTLDIPLGDGDTRPLVRHLRMLAYYVSAVILKNGKNNCSSSNSNSNRCEIVVTQKEKSCNVAVSDNPFLELKVGTLDNLFPVKPQIFDTRTDQIMKTLRANQSDLLPESSLNELSTILDFWLGGALAPAVILSQNQCLVETLISSIETALTTGDDGNVQCISNIEAGSYKMMKSLYDPRDTPNLRDDILKLGGGRRTNAGGVGKRTTLVAMHLRCANTDAQLCLREMLEDSPSMTAFSSDRSALYKNGLLFAVHIQKDDEITPELQSRASLIL